MQFEEKFINISSYTNWLQLQRIPSHKISYLEFGNPSNENVIICTHGLTRNCYDFVKIATALSNNFRVIALTYPGRGNSDYFKDKSHYNYPVYIKETIFFLEKLAIKKLFWLGTSMGGIIGMVLASRCPELFKGLILNDIGPFIPASNLARIGKYAAQNPYFDDLIAAKQHLKMIYSQFGIIDENDWDYITKYSFKKTPEGKYQMNYDPSVVHSMKTRKKPKDVSIWSVWHKISCPLMVIHGAKSDILQQPTVEMMKRTKDFQLYTVSYAGHAPALMSVDQITAIKLWLSKFC